MIHQGPRCKSAARPAEAAPACSNMKYAGADTAAVYKKPNIASFFKPKAGMACWQMPCSLPEQLRPHPLVQSLLPLADAVHTMQHQDHVFLPKNLKGLCLCTSLHPGCWASIALTGHAAIHDLARYRYHAGAAKASGKVASMQPKSEHTDAPEDSEPPSASPSDVKIEPSSVKAEQGAEEPASQSRQHIKAECEADVESKPEPGMQAGTPASQAAAERHLAAQMDAGAAGKLQEAGVPCEQPAASDCGAAQPSVASQPAAGVSPHAAAASKRKAPAAASARRKPYPAKKSKGPGGRTAQISSYFTKNSA